jgi:2-polyprenyl-6-hydroxyphenyl methylase/3-demethylubiquinone-9 3-methyltransferase
MTSFPASAGRPLSLRPVDPRPVPCKVCGAEAPLFGVQDFNRSCEEQRGKFLPLAGAPVYYRRCGGCGLLFSDAFDDWPDEAFAAHIYNEGYAAVDPDFEARRPVSNAGLIARTFRDFVGSLDVLDYGGGNGRLATELARAGFRSTQTYDRFHPAHRERPAGRFNCVTCFETIEHMPAPKAGAADIASFLADDALIVLSTVVQPKDIDQQRMQWWYAGPRNGHITLFTYKALARLFAVHGLKLYPTSSPAMHLLCREIPDFARHVLRATQPVPV